uniref:Uncharacterized protein n=1 Tax=Plectus sambesii TaxID=2011161 RepID=A0A914VUS8_9BILA
MFEGTADEANWPALNAPSSQAAAAAAAAASLGVLLTPFADPLALRRPGPSAPLKESLDGFRISSSLSPSALYSPHRRYSAQ